MLSDDEIIAVWHSTPRNAGEDWQAFQLRLFRAAITAYQAKLLAGVELPEEFTVFTEDEPNSVIHGYTKDQLLQYAAACAAQARREALDEAKGVCMNYSDWASKKGEK